MNQESHAINRCFVDSNIWLYAFIQSQEGVKTGRAKSLIQQHDIVVSTQVINEVSINLIKKASWSEVQILELIKAFYSKYRVVELNQAILLKSSELRGAYKLSFWDSLMVSSALQAGVLQIYSEDMQHGLLVENQLRILNPFV